jgi:hypothetical protein
MGDAEEIRSLAVSVLRLMKGRKRQSFPVAFSVAFQKSDLNPKLYQTVRIGVKSFLRFWREKKRMPEQLTLFDIHPHPD